MDRQYREAMQELDDFVKSRSSARYSSSTFIHDADQEPDLREQLASCERFLKRLEEESKKGQISTTDFLAWRSLAVKRAEEIQEQLGDTSEVEVVGKSLGFALAMGSPAARLGMQLARDYQGRVDPAYLAWFGRAPLAG